ncbi:MazG-like family protein [Nocardia sp. NPDC049220]|uniref:MazG-like family protein n=1 Tax=Nocardia sp. NPDC049220 TaxID=3155273 RepID=UPI0033F1ACBD
MDRTEIERIANTVVLDHLTTDIGYGAIYGRHDCYDVPEQDLNTIHNHVHEALKQVAENFQTTVGHRRAAALGAESETIKRVAQFLNAHNGSDDAAMTMQMLKLQEELGEVAKAAGDVAAAWIGYTGQNPRKGVTHSLEDVVRELADVAITAMLGIARLGGDPTAQVSQKIAVIQAWYEALKPTPMSDTPTNLDAARAPHDLS